MRKLKEILTVIFTFALVIATITLVGIEIGNTGTISGLSLIPFLIGLIWFGVTMMAKDFKEFKEIYEAADDE